MQTTIPQLSGYLQFFDLLSALEDENLITYKEKQQLKISLTLKDKALMNMIALNMGGEAEDFRFSVLNYIKNSQLSTNGKHQRQVRRSKSTISPELTQLRLPPNLHLSGNDIQIDEDEVMKSVESLNKTIFSIVQQEQLGKVTSQKLTESLYHLSKYLARFDPNQIQSMQDSIEKDKVDIITNLKQIYKKIKKNFSKYMHSHLLLMDEFISYEQLFTLLKLLSYLLVGCNSFSFVVIREEGCDIFQSETDSYLKINQDLKEELQLIPNDKLKTFGSQYIQLDGILGSKKQIRSYIHRINQSQDQNTQIYFVYHQSLALENKINYNFLQLTNEYEFFDDLNELSLFLYDTIKQAKVQFFSPLQIAHTVQDIGLSFVRCSKYLLIEKMLQELTDKKYIVNKMTNSDDSPAQRSPQLNKNNQDAIILEFKDTLPIFVQFQNINLVLKRDRNILLEVQQSYDKYLRFIKQSYEKRAFYKYFLRSNDSLIFEFDKRGQLCFLSRPIPKSISEKYKITFNLGMVQHQNIRYNKIFEENTEIISAIESHLQQPNVWKINNTDFSDSCYEIIIKERCFKGFVVVFQQHQEAWIKNQQKSLAPNLNGHLDQEIKRRIRKSVLQHETLNFVSKLSENIEMSNSIALLYMPQVKKHQPTRMLQSANQSSMQSPRTILKQSTKSFDVESTKETQQEQKSRYFTQFKIEINSFELTENDNILDTIDYNILETQSKIEKHRVVWAILTRNNFIEEFNIPNDQLGEFLTQLENKYNSTKNIFHNYDHGVAVMQFTHYLTKISVKAKYQIDYFTQFTLQIAALCHDVAHTGRTNLFEINSLSSLAIRYHDKSVLEQHHAATTIQILREEKSNILINLEDDQFKLFRKKLIQNILATDMSDHFKLVSDLESRIKETEKTFGESEHDEKLLTGMIIHCADLNGGVREYPVSHRWSKLVNQEFILQYKEEGKLGYPQLPYMKDLNKMFVMAKSEMGFFKVIVRPLYQLLSTLFEGQLIACVNNIDETILEWDKIYSQELAIQQLDEQLPKKVFLK